MSATTSDLASLLSPQGQWSEAEYLLLNVGRLVEFDGGTVEVLAMPTRLHQKIAVLLYNLLVAFVAAEPGADVLIAPFAVRLWPGKMRQPDVSYMSGRHADRQFEDHWDGADLVVEVVGDDERRRDLDVKRREYARAGIPEYWIVDPMLLEVTVFALVDDRYEPAGVHRSGGRAASVLLAGFDVAVDDLFNAR